MKENSIDPEQVFNKVSVPRSRLSEIGISLWYFNHKLFHQLHEDLVEDVFFISKEGEYKNNYLIDTRVWWSINPGFIPIIGISQFTNFCSVYIIKFLL